MAEFSKQLLSGSTRGQPILVAATATPGTAIHDTGISATVIDEIHLWAQNTDTTAAGVKLTIEFGGVTAPNNLFEVTLPPESGLIAIVPGLCLVGTGAAASSVKAFAATTNVVTVSGFVNRISS